MKFKIFEFIFIISFKFILSAVPNWNFDNLAIDIMTTNPLPYTIYTNNNNLELKKTITKSDTGISSQNSLTFGTHIRNVEFESIESYYQSQLHCDYIVCPKGSFHPLIMENGNQIIPPCFSKGGDWNLRCYRHDTGFFLLFYSNNGRNNIISSKDSGGSWDNSNHLVGELYDFKLTQGNNGNNGEYPMMYISKESGYLKLFGMKLILKTDDVHKMAGGQTKTLCKAKTYTHALFNENSDKYYYITYDETSIESGYSNTDTISSYVDLTGYSNTHNGELNFQFADNIQIQNVSLIPNTKYAYYTIYNIDKEITYHGLIDIEKNKIIYNLAEEIKTFIPYSTTEMLAITSNSAYKLCIVKSGGSCNSCDNLILDPDGNSCGSQCSTGKILLVPEGICIEKDSCDQNIYTLNSDETQCGLCSYFSSTSYKLINTSGCIDSTPLHAVYYNEKSNLLKCDTHYRANDEHECIPETCYELCEECSDYSEDSNDQKCTSCKGNYELDAGNCKEVVAVPTTQEIIPTTQEVTPTTHIITEAPATTPETEKIEECVNKKCFECSVESNKLELCLSCDITKYKVVNFTDKYPQYVNCLEPKKVQTKYYYDNEINQYRPCYSTCKTCSGHGNLTAQNCIECDSNYMLRPG